MSHKKLNQSFNNDENLQNQIDKLNTKIEQMVLNFKNQNDRLKEIKEEMQSQEKNNKIVEETKERGIENQKKLFGLESYLRKIEDQINRIESRMNTLEKIIQNKNEKIEK